MSRKTQQDVLQDKTKKTEEEKPKLGTRKSKYCKKKNICYENSQ